MRDSWEAMWLAIANFLNDCVEYVKYKFARPAKRAIRQVKEKVDPIKPAKEMVVDPYWFRRLKPSREFVTREYELFKYRRRVDALLDPLEVPLPQDKQLQPIYFDQTGQSPFWLDDDCRLAELVLKEYRQSPR